MKPSFALTLSDETIGLVHRTPQGWTPVGEVRVDAPDLAEALTFLRSSALGLEPQGISTKLVIPNSEILYLTLTAPGPRPAARRKQIAAALEGRTPYDVADLVFDWSGNGDEVQVAVVARETLETAEDFATTHRFAPVSFVAIPPSGAFGAEPWFGTTKAAEQVLEAGARVERDQDPIRLGPRGTRAGDGAVAAGDAAVAAQDAGTAVVAAEGSPADVADFDAPSDGMDGPLAEVALAIADDLGADATPVAAGPAGADADVEGAPESAAPVDPVVDHVRDTPPAPAETFEERVAKVVARSGAEASALTFTSRRSADAEVPEAGAMPDGDTSPGAGDRPTGLDATSGGGAPVAAAASEAADAPTHDAGEGGNAFVADAARARAVPTPEGPRRTAAPVIDDTRVNDTPIDDTPIDEAPSDEAPFEEIELPPAAPPPFAAVRPAGAGAPPPLTAVTAAPAAGEMPAPRVEKPVKPAKAPPPRQGKSPRAATPPPALRAASVAASLRPLSPLASSAPPRPTPPAKSAKAVSGQGAAQDMAVFGSRSKMPGPRRPLGLILTGALVVVLILVGIWATLFLDTPEATGSNATADVPVVAVDAGAEAPGDAAVADGAVADGAVADGAPAVFGTAESDPILPEPVTPEVVAPEVVLAEPVVPELPVPDTSVADAPAPEAVVAAPAPPETRAPEPEAVVADVVAPEAPAALAQTTTPPTSGGRGERSADTEPLNGAVEQIALPAPDIPVDAVRVAPSLRTDAGTDPAPRAAMPPPPFGTVYQFAADGTIQPTPEGVITPDGVRLVAGRPAVVPPRRPDSVTAPAAAAVVDTGAAIAAAVAAAPPAGASTAGVDAPVVGAVAPEPVPDPALAGARPRTRPASVTTAPAAPEAAPATTEAPPAGGTVQEDGALREAGEGLQTVSRPRARTASIVAAAEAQRAAEVAAAAARATEIASASPLAVAISRKPAARPAGLRAVAVVSTASAPAAAPAAQPQDDGEPDTRAAAPTIPTRASVAKQATVTRAINLSNLNLIGVYGAANNRHALVRDGDGGFSRVKIGDRLDGGRVSAIGESDLSYVKGGRTIKLALPKG